MNITEALSHPSVRARVAHMTELRRQELAAQKAARHEAWWHDHEAGPSNDSGNGGGAVLGCLAIALLLYAALAWAWIR